MKKQTLKLTGICDFEPKHIFECGQCFRWNRQKDSSYIGVVNNMVLQVKKENDNLEIIGVGDENLESLCKEYFDLETDYQKIKRELGQVDSYLKNSIGYGYGIRILKQTIWETLISFIVSANNNIPRIKGILERLSKSYGRPIQYGQNRYYTFPTPEELAKATIPQLRELGLGFRDKRLYQTTKLVVEGKINLDEWKNEDTQEVRQKLMEIPGVGPKVADCILLFGYHRLEVFPIDVWVRRVMNELYLKQPDETKVKTKEIEQVAQEKYKELAGIAQQYLFYWKRDTA